MTIADTPTIPTPTDLGDDPAWTIQVAAVIAADLGRPDLVDLAAKAIAAQPLAQLAEDGAAAARAAATAPAVYHQRLVDAIAEDALPALDFHDADRARVAHEERAALVGAYIRGLAKGVTGPLTADDDALLATCRALAARGWNTAQRQVSEARVRHFGVGYAPGFQARTELEEILVAQQEDPNDVALRLGHAVQTGPRGGIRFGGFGRR